MIEELMAIGNRDPLRGEDAAQPLSPFKLDAIALALLARQSLTSTSVPEAGRIVTLRYNGDLTIDETDRLHPDTAEQCVLAARAVGLDVAGIDLIANDISKPLEPQGGAVIEVNSSPGLIMHLKPLVGFPRPVGEAIIGQLFSADQTGRVPLCAVSGTNGKTLVAGLIADILRASGSKVGHVSSDGLRVGDRVLASGERCDAASMRRALMNPYSDAFVFEIDEPHVLEEGVIFDRCEVAVVTNLGSGDHLGGKYVDELTPIYKAVRAPVDIVLPTGHAVLNADDPEVLEMAKHTKGTVLLFARSEHSPAVIEHLRTEGRAVVRDGAQLVLCHGTRRTRLLDLADLRCAVLGLPAFLVDDLLAAVAGAVALGSSAEQIAAGIAHALQASPNFAAGAPPGVAVFDLPATGARPEGGLLVLTPAHNESALAAWAQHFAEYFSGRLASVLFEPSSNWLVSEAAGAVERLAQRFSRVAIALNSYTRPFVEAVEMARTGHDDRPAGPYLDLMASIDQLLEGQGASDLFCVAPANAQGFSSTLLFLETKGLSRRSVSGLASVRHCR
ncbi:MAG: Mur ligase family protein [Polyangiaceae bacterium]